MKLCWPDGPERSTTDPPERTCGESPLLRATEVRLVKYVVRWTVQKALREEDNKRLLDLFSKWEPAANIEQMLGQVDGMGGFNIVETDDPRDLARDVSKFQPYLDFSIYPVMDLNETAQIFAEAIEYQASVQS